MNFLKPCMSMASAVILFLIFAIAAAAATIIESIYGTSVAWSIVYGSWWFALIQILLGINLAYNLFKYKLFSIKKIPVMLFHVSFLIILIGAGMTRYLGFEGTMHIRNGGASDEIRTSKNYVLFQASDTNSIKHEINKYSDNFTLSLPLDNKSANLKLQGYEKDVGYGYKDSKGGEPIIELIISNETSAVPLILKKGKSVNIAGYNFSFDANATTDNYVKFSLKDGNFTMQSNNKINCFIMNDNSTTLLEANKINEFTRGKLYTIGNINFAPKLLSTSAKKELIKVENGGEDAFIALLTYNGKSKRIPIFTNGKTTAVKLDGQTFLTRIGTVMEKLPFEIQLNKFKLDRYPGSRSPMGYASDIVVQDSNKSMNYEIYMNHVLDYNGYRFFQSSYDADEKGTILSVNKDPGKIPTYIGYFLLGLGLFLNILNPNSRFRKLASIINKDAMGMILATIMSIGILNTQLKADEITSINKLHANNLATLLIQSQDGRIEPFNTVAYDILNKIYKKTTYKGLDPDQVVLSMMVNSNYWQKVPIIYVNGKALRKLIGIGENQKYASFDDFFSNGNKEYKLTKFVELANRKRPSERNTLDKDIIKVDERVNVLYLVFVGEIFRMFPKIDDPNHTWFAPASAMLSFDKSQGTKVSLMLKDYFGSVVEAQKNGDWSKADTTLNTIKNYQKSIDPTIIPSQNKIKLEILLNRYSIFNNLVPVYLLSGLILLIMIFAKITNPKRNIKPIFKVIWLIVFLGFIAHVIGLIARWYVSGHAPWSNAYESLIYIALAMIVAGLIFAKKSMIALSLTSILAGVTLFVAHLSWLDPQITTLVPVLNSYWLTIHVSVITSSYGFFGLCALLGIYTLILMLLQGKQEKKELSRSILEATRINEMSMILGISLLTLGNFLGGVWANESWGRYWSWDSKETWALISILVYAAVLHMRFIPKLNNQYAFAVASSFAYWSIIMTYFGVNFYLTGMHSYASGDPVPVPSFIWISLIVMVLIAILGYKGKRFAKTL